MKQVDTSSYTTSRDTTDMAQVGHVLAFLFKRLKVFFCLTGQAGAATAPPRNDALEAGFRPQFHRQFVYSEADQARYANEENVWTASEVRAYDRRNELLCAG